MLLQRELGARAVVFDLDGTLYQDGRPLPGAVETVAALRDSGLPVRFLTNTTSRSRRAVGARLRELGFLAEDAEVYSPPVAAGAFLRREGATAHLLVQDEALEDFAGVHRDDDHPDFVVLGDLGAGWTFPRLNRAFQLLHEAGADLLALGRTRYWQTAAGLQLDAGAFVAALEYASGKRARVFGKPDVRFFRAIVADLDCPTEAVVVVGDDLDTDVGGARAAGLCGVLVRTGKFRPTDLEGRHAADLVIDSVADLLS